ncbi:MAG TPA: MOSC N-terminal beta barrel domain-containing protein [Opitutus sp.]|nr:MOSC N-terminal beta barrel domain-containing protein [Opitutus sp.]
MHLSGLFIYPVKSLRGCPAPAAAVDALGLVGDRRFLVVDESGRFLTQRTLPRMAQIATALTADTLTLSADSHGSIAVGRASRPPSDPPRSISVSVWRSENLLADDCGNEAAAWLSSFLSTPCRLVRIGARFRRPVLKSAAQPGDVVSFADAVPFLAISEASLADLNDRLVARGEDALPMNRFRPNLVIAGAPAAFAEDKWPRVRIGEIVLRSAGPSARCAVTTTDQLTGERGLEPLRTLATYRRSPSDPTDVIFGQNLIHETLSGSLRMGDTVTPL